MFFYTALFSWIYFNIFFLSAVSGEDKPKVCDRGMFKCRIIPQCIGQWKFCDNVTDCVDESDEDLCSDRHADDMWNLIFSKRPDADREEAVDICGLKQIPDECECNDFTKIYCTNEDLRSVPSHIPEETTHLDLSGNRITQIRQIMFQNLTNLEVLILMHSDVEEIEMNAFAGNPKLREVYLTDNLISRFPRNMFPEENSLEILHLSYNVINEVGSNAFTGLTRLKQLKLDYNMIYKLHPDAFNDTQSLTVLHLSHNKLRRIERELFMKLPRLTFLNLLHNEISDIEYGSFSRLKSLKTLSLAENFLTTIRSRMFDGLENVEALDLRGNSILGIETDAFTPLQNLKTLDLRKNPLPAVKPALFMKMTSLQFVYLEHFFQCGDVPSNIECSPKTDGISTRNNLLENVFLRIAVWVVALTALLGNLIVLLGRSLLKEDNQIHSFFIKNLSLADLLMAIYLLVVGSRDVQYRGNYILFDKKWRNSWECDICGIICTISSEVSVLTLAIITLDRYISIKYPLTLRKRNLKLAALAMTFIWVICFLLSALPISGIRYFGTMFYRTNAVCIPLHFHDARIQGWEYSAFIFVGINLLSFMFIIYAYISMLAAIRTSTLPLRSMCVNQDRCLVKRFFFIVFTDFMCWFPIIIIKISVFFGARISGSLYAWIVVFILPINSAINPLLYTITTKLFKQKFLPKFITLLLKRKYTREVSSWSTFKSRMSRRSTQDTELDLFGMRDRGAILGFRYKQRFGVNRHSWPARRDQIPNGYKLVPIKS